MSRILYTVQEDYLHNFKTNNDPFITDLETYAKENKVPILNWHAAEFMEQLIQIQQPKRVLEIGTAIAYSSIRIAKILRKKAMLYTIEKSEDNAAKARENIANAELESKINLIVGDALEVLPKLKKKFDFIFLDADKEDYQRLFDYSLILLRKNGIIFVDNLLWHGYTAAPRVPANYKTSTGHIREFNKVFMSQSNLKSSILPIGDGIGLGIRIK